MCHPSVQIGLNQNAYEEVNQAYMDEHGIGIVRRETGGGAIYLDDKNMSFCYLLNTDNHTDIFGNYAKLYEPIVEVLEDLGVEGLHQVGRNDLTLNGQKISGAAMTVVNGRIYAGYSLLLDPDFEVMEKVLNPSKKKIASHGVKSVRARVGTLRPALDPKYQDIDVYEFTDLILCKLLQIDDIQDAKRYELTAKDWAAIDEIVRTRYNNWDWTYGRFKAFEAQVQERVEGVGTLHIGLNVKHAKIEGIQISGDFFGIQPVEELEGLLQGVRLKRQAIEEALNEIDIADYISKLDLRTFVDIVLGIYESHEGDSQGD